MTDRSLGLDFARDQQASLELIANGAPIGDVLAHIITTIEAQAPGMRGSILTLPDGRHLRHGAAGKLPQEYCDAIDGIEIGSGVGSCGTAMAENRRVIVTDIASDPLWSDFRDFALSFGLRACWSTPLNAADGRVIGSFAMYYDAPREPSERELLLADAASHLCALALESESTAEQLRRRAAEQTAVADISQRALAGYDLDDLCAALVERVSAVLDGAPAAIFAYDENDATRVRAGCAWPTETSGGAGAEDPGEDVLRIEVPGQRGPWGVLVVRLQANRARNGDHLFLRALVNVLAAGIERTRAEEQFRHQALHDPLTGLPNRTLLISLLDHVLERDRRAGGTVAVLLLDLDNFKAINDGHGHVAGDEVLARLAPRLNSVVRESDTVGRIGGDEFVVVAEQVDGELGAVTLAERLLEQLRQPVDIGGRRHTVTASVGIALTCDGAAVGESLLRDADAAMYQVKAQGGDGHQLFDAAMRERAAARKRLIDALQQSLDRTAFELEFQPVVSLEDRRPVGSEALLRWPEAPRDVPGPSVFVPVAEESGLITPIGAWVLEVACREAASWPAGGSGRWISVNISARQLAAPGFAQSVRETLERHGLEAKRLMLEVPEGVVTEDTRATRVALLELADLGVLLALDDVGTGFAALHHALSLPIHALKIDGQFVTGLPESGQARAVVAGVTAMAHELGKLVIVEGVETDAQLAAAEAFGCDLGQGYLFGRPVPGPELFRQTG